MPAAVDAESLPATGKSLSGVTVTLAANDERSLSDYLRMVLTHHAYGRAGTVPREAGAGE